MVKMIIGIKDITKLFAITIVSCCATFVCALFLNYNLDIVEIQSQITTPQGRVLYDALVATGKVVVGVSGGCLVITTVIMLIFYVKQYIDSHSKDLGILKALGYSNFRIAKHFWVFGISVFVGSVLGYLGAWAYIPTFYAVQNAEGLLPEILPRFHFPLAFSLLVIPTAFFMLLSVLYACRKLKTPVLDLLQEIRYVRVRIRGKDTGTLPFLENLRKCTLSGRRILVFFVGFSAFCFSAMTQMAMSMEELSSESFSWMILSIGLILAFMTLLMSLTSVVKANTKTIAMMKVFGYSEKECSRAILGGYRPVSYIGFAIGTAYQYLLLRIMVDIVFADYANMPTYRFDFKALGISLVTFVISYELIICCHARKIGKQSIKSVMLS